MEGWTTAPARHINTGAGTRAGLKSQPNTVKARISHHPKTDPASIPNSRWTADTEGGSTRARGYKQELKRSRGVLALMASQYSKSLLKLLKKDIHMGALEKKATQCLQNIK